MAFEAVLRVCKRISVIDVCLRVLLWCSVLTANAWSRLPKMVSRGKVFIRLTILHPNQTGIFRTTGNIFVEDCVAVKCCSGLLDYGFFLPR